MASVLQAFNRAVPIEKSDTVNFPGGICDAIYVGTAGVVAVVMQDDSVVNFTAVAGGILPVRAKRVNSTNTVPTLMVALYQV
jgi:hypothetical protein